jgi:predicted esterase YcpF (UPF0227 family)
MIIYLHGFDSNSPGNHEKVLQLQFIDPDVRLISYSTRHPKHDMQHLLKEVDKMLQLNVDDRPLICGVGLGGYWAERIGFLCDIRQVVFNPNLSRTRTWKAKLTARKSMSILRPSASAIFGRKTATAAW